MAVHGNAAKRAGETRRTRFQEFDDYQNRSSQSDGKVAIQHAIGTPPDYVAMSGSGIEVRERIGGRELQLDMVFIVRDFTTPRVVF